MGLEMDRVAAVAGVSKQTIYSHFGDKEGLFKALMERATINRFRPFFCNEKLSGEPAIVLREVAETFLTLKSDPEYHSLMRIIISECLRPYETWEPFQAEALRFWHIFLELAEPTGIQRLGVCYINQIPLEDDEQPSHYLKIVSTTLPDLALPTESFFYQDT
jgi:AcrR family transcriptional regulator